WLGTGAARGALPDLARSPLCARGLPRVRSPRYLLGRRTTRPAARPPSPPAPPRAPFLSDARAVARARARAPPRSAAYARPSHDPPSLPPLFPLHLLFFPRLHNAELRSALDRLIRLRTRRTHRTDRSPGCSLTRQ